MHLTCLMQLSKIFFARQDETLLRTNTAMQGNLDMMERISLENQEHNRNLSQIAEQSQNDSRSLKALTMIATTYLPASLVAV